MYVPSAFDRTDQCTNRTAHLDTCRARKDTWKGASTERPDGCVGLRDGRSYTIPTRLAQCAGELQRTIRGKTRGVPVAVGWRVTCNVTDRVRGSDAQTPGLKTSSPLAITTSSLGVPGARLLQHPTADLFPSGLLTQYVADAPTGLTIRLSMKNSIIRS
jgi:hypothetical protein